MYREKFPEPEQVIMIKVRRVENLGAYVSMLEYNNAEGMVMLSELSKRRIRSIKNLIRAGQIMAVAVIRVDQNKGYVDLSRRRVSHEEQQEMEEKFAKSKMVHSVMRHTAQQKPDTSLEQLCEMIAWPLYELYPHAYDAFKILASSAADEVWSKLQEKTGETISDELKEQLISNIKRRLTVNATRLRATVDVTCYEYEGIDAVREALRAGQACECDDAKLQVTLIAPPQYSISTTCIDRAAGYATVEKAMKAIETSITKAGGNFLVHQKTEVVGNDDDQETYADDLDSSSDESDESGDQEGMGELDDDAMEALKNMKVEDDE